MATLSVLIPSFEAGRFLVDAVASVSKQTSLVAGESLEIVIANDGAIQPESLAALEIVARNPLVRIVNTSGRTGPSRARNLAAEHANGEWLVFLDADDVFPADAISTRLAIAKRFPQATCVATDYAEVSEDFSLEEGDTRRHKGIVAGHAVRRRSVQAAFDTGAPIQLIKPLASFVGSIPFWTGAVMVRKESFARLGGFPAGHRIGEDLHLWLRIAATEVIAYSPQITAYYRVGQPSLTRDEREMNLKTARCFEELALDPLMLPVRHAILSLAAEAYLAESYSARKTGAVWRAMKMSIKAALLRPAHVRTWLQVLKSGVRPVESPTP